MPETRYAKRGDTYIAYQVMGDGPLDLVYVPGFMTQLDMQLEQPLYARNGRYLARHIEGAKYVEFSRCWPSIPSRGGKVWGAR